MATICLAATGALRSLFLTVVQLIRPLTRRSVNTKYDELLCSSTTAHFSVKIWPTHALPFTAALMASLHVRGQHSAQKVCWVQESRACLPVENKMSQAPSKCRRRIAIAICTLYQKVVRQQNDRIACGLHIHGSIGRAQRRMGVCCALDPAPRSGREAPGLGSSSTSACSPSS